MKTIFLSVLLAMAVPGFPDSETPFALGGSVALLGNLLTSHGAVAELDFRETFAVQLQFYRHSEFQGIFPRDENLPYEDYLQRGINFGVYRKHEGWKLGVYAGAQLVTGTIRGAFDHSDSTYTMSFGGDGKPYGLNRYYDAIAIDNVLFPVKISAGYCWRHVGLFLSPQAFYFRHQVSWNIPLGIEFGWL